MLEMPPKRREKFKEFSTVRLSVVFAFVSFVALWAPWNIYSGVRTGIILVPLCRWDCMVTAANPGGFAGAILLWIITFILTGLCAFGFGLVLWGRRKR